MKLAICIRRLSLRWLLFCLIASIGAFSLPVRADDAEAQDLMEKAEQLERKAQDLKAEGQHDRARQTMAEVKELRALAAKRKADSEDNPRAREFKREMKAAKEELKKLRAESQEDEAVELKKKIQGMEREIERGGPEPRFRREGGQRPRPEGAPAPGGEAERRLRHIEIAIENLHAAGMHEPADHLAQAAEGLRQQLQGGPQPGAPRPGMRAAQGEIQQLRGELDELRRLVRQLNARLEEMSRERR